MGRTTMKIVDDGIGNKLYEFSRDGSTVLMDDVELDVFCAAHSLDVSDADFVDGVGRILLDELDFGDGMAPADMGLDGNYSIDEKRMVAIMLKMGFAYV